jgi:cytochrome-b5 reductase
MLAIPRIAVPFQRVGPETAVALLISGLVGAYALQRYLIKDTFAETPSPQPVVFTGLPFGFTSLRLQSVQEVNHDTKRLRFELPDPKSRTGLGLTCTLFWKKKHHQSSRSVHQGNADFHLAALLTMHRPAGSLFPVVRPYTPINDLGKINPYLLVVTKN